MSAEYRGQWAVLVNSNSSSFTRCFAEIMFNQGDGAYGEPTFSLTCYRGFFTKENDFIFSSCLIATETSFLSFTSLHPMFSAFCKVQRFVYRILVHFYVNISDSSGLPKAGVGSKYWSVKSGCMFRPFHIRALYTKKNLQRMQIQDQLAATPL